MKHGHSPTDDELLSALIDGALPADEVAGLERRLVAEPALASRLRQLKDANAAVRDAYASVAAEPLPSRVLDLVNAAQRDNAASAGVVDLATRRRTRDVRFAPLPVSLAAGIALAVGLSVGYVVTSRAPSPDTALIASAGNVATGTPLHEALEMTASATVREIEAGVTVTPTLTFQTTDGDYCRHLDIATEGGSGEALACRREGQWRLDAVSFAARAGTPGGEFRPASRSGVIDAAIDERIAGEPLDAAREAALIERRWSNR